MCGHDLSHKRLPHRKLWIASVFTWGVAKPCICFFFSFWPIALVGYINDLLDGLASGNAVVPFVMAVIGLCCPLSASFSRRYWSLCFWQNVTNFTLLGDSREISAACWDSNSEVHAFLALNAARWRLGQRLPITFYNTNEKLKLQSSPPKFSEVNSLKH